MSNKRSTQGTKETIAELLGAENLRREEMRGYLSDLRASLKNPSPKTERGIARIANTVLAAIANENPALVRKYPDQFKPFPVPAIPARLPEGRSRRKVCGKGAVGKIPNAYPKVKGTGDVR